MTGRNFVDNTSHTINAHSGNAGISGITIPSPLERVRERLIPSPSERARERPIPSPLERARERLIPSPLERVRERLIGIFGGSFNPIHTGHIHLARQILRKAGLDEVWFMVSPLNPFKKEASDLLDDHLRLEMAEKALENESGLKASDYEFNLPKPSYTWSTLQHLSEDYPSCRFSLIIGADNWLAFDRWARPDYILSHFNIIVYPREGYPIDAASLPHGVTLVDTELYPVSSTEIRRLVREGKSIKGLVPDNIVDLVERYYR